MFESYLKEMFLSYTTNGNKNYFHSFYFIQADLSVKLLGVYDLQILGQRTIQVSLNTFMIATTIATLVLHVMFSSDRLTEYIRIG